GESIKSCCADCYARQRLRGPIRNALMRSGAVRDLGIFAKYWEPGAVKTRLAATVGAEAAARLQREFVRTIAARTGALADRRAFVVTPPERLAEFATLAGPQWSVKRQSSGDLGARMRNYFQTSFADGATYAVL